MCFRPTREILARHEKSAYPDGSRGLGVTVRNPGLWACLRHGRPVPAQHGSGLLGGIFLAFNQDIAPGRVSLVAGIMGCIGSLMGALRVWPIGGISKTRGFNEPFWIIPALVIAGTLPAALAGWEPRAAKEAQTV